MADASASASTSTSAAAAAAAATAKLHFALRRSKKRIASSSSSSCAATTTSTSSSAQPIGSVALSSASLQPTSEALVIPMTSRRNGDDTKPLLLLRVGRRHRGRDGGHEGGEGDDDDEETRRVREEVALLPDTASAAAYERVPVASFGAGLLRGMGWNDGGKIGLSNAAVVKPVEAVRRAHRLGLGARVHRLPEAARRDAAGRVDRRFQRDHEDEERCVWKVGDAVHIVSGAHKGLSGVVQDVYDDKTRAKVRLTASNEVVALSLRRLAPSSAHKRLPTPAKRPRRDERDHDDEHQGGEALRWVIPNLLVRVCSKEVDGGRQYRRKARVLDVVSRLHFTVVTEDGRVLERLRERDVETVVSRDAGAAMIVVAGRHRGDTGTLLQRDTNAQRAVVALGEHGDRVRRFHLDHVCQLADEAFNTIR